MQTGKANYRLAARLRGNELLLDADLRKAVEEEHLRAVRRAEGLKCCADRRAFAEANQRTQQGVISPSMRSSTDCRFSNVRMICR